MNRTADAGAANFGSPSLLLNEGITAAQRGDWDAATAALQSLLQQQPDDLIAWTTLAGVHGRRGDGDGEFQALQKALSIDPFYLPALLLKGNWYEARGEKVLAATGYTHALQVSPPESAWPDQMRAELSHARDFVSRYNDGLHRHLRSSLEAVDDIDGRWQEALAIRAGVANPYLSYSNQLHIPRLPAIPFFERSMFNSLAALEQATDAIRDELESAIQARQADFQPYVSYREGEPVNQWQALNNSHDWDALHLWRNGVAVQENLSLFPQTEKILSEVSLCDLDGLCPNVFFSVLAPGAHIPPHHGESNARVIAHLPLIVPEKCRLRVGADQREWQPGECLVFDDTIEHEAWNDSNERRIVMIFDLWNPLLGSRDRQLASELAKATREYTGR